MTDRTIRSMFTAVAHFVLVVVLLFASSRYSNHSEEVKLIAVAGLFALLAIAYRPKD